MNEILALIIGGGFFSFLGVIVTLWFTRRKSQAETEKTHAEIKKLKEEAEKLEIENQNMRMEQMNTVMKRSDDLEKAKEELKAKLYIANEEKLLLSQELHTQRIESNDLMKKLSASQKIIEESLASQNKDIAEIKKKTGQLPEQMPGSLEHEK
jgi:hypothetical protein